MTTQYSNIPLEESQVIRVLRELTGEEQGEERCGLDLVIMFDISITNIVNGVLKTSTECVINALGPIDRLSVFTFSDDANMLCGLRKIHEKSKQDILNLVGGIVPDYGVINISEAIETALQLLNARKLAEGRSVGIILMTNSEHNTSENASQIKSGSVPVHIFSFGSSGKESLILPHVLEPIAGSSSHGETFSRKSPRLRREEYKAMGYQEELFDDYSEEEEYERSSLLHEAMEISWPTHSSQLAHQKAYVEEELTSLTLSSQLAYERPGFTTRDDTKKQT